jgi:hypothetical protein
VTLLTPQSSFSLLRIILKHVYVFNQMEIKNIEEAYLLLKVISYLPSKLNLDRKPPE